MQLIRDIHAARRVDGRPVISFEFFPPKTEDGERTLFEKTLPALKALQPDFCSVTYGAGGSTRDKTLGITERIQRDLDLTAMAHLTCVNATKEQIREVALDARRRGIRNILALRGDPPGGAEFKKTEGGFEYSYELVNFLRELGGFSVGTAGFPEGHIACKDGKQIDWQRLKAKIDCGADFVVTQLFFDNSDFFEFRDFLTKLGVSVPICPGILPILSGGQIKRFTALCGATLSADLISQLDHFGDDETASTAFGIDYAAKQCEELRRGGVESFHFYTLNKVHSTREILKNLNWA